MLRWNVGHYCRFSCSNHLFLHFDIISYWSALINPFLLARDLFKLNARHACQAFGMQEPCKNVVDGTSIGYLSCGTIVTATVPLNSNYLFLQKTG